MTYEERVANMGTGDTQREEEEKDDIWRKKQQEEKQKEGSLRARQRKHQGVYQ